MLLKKTTIVLMTLISFTNINIFCTEQELTPKQNAEIEQILKESDEFLKETDRYIKEADDYLEDSDGILKEVEEKLKQLDKFNDKLIGQFKIDIPIQNTTFPVSCGIYKNDLIKIPLYAINSIVDNSLKYTLSNFYSQKIFLELTKKTKFYIDLIQNITPPEQTNISDKKNKKKTFTAQAKKNLSDESIKKIKETFNQINFTHCEILKHLVSNKFLLYILYSEFFNYIKVKLLIGKKKLGFSDFFRYPDKPTLLYIASKQPIPLHHLLSMFFNPYLKGLSTNFNFFKQAINEFVIDPFKYYEHTNKETNEIECKKYLFFKIWDSYANHLLKKSLAFTNAVKRIQSEVFMKSLIKKIKTNPQKLCLLLKNYEKYKSQNNKQELSKTTNEIVDFIKINFNELNVFEWIKIKNKFFVKSEFKTNLLFSIPTFILISKYLWSKYKDGTLSKIYNEFKSLTT